VGALAGVEPDEGEPLNFPLSLVSGNITVLDWSKLAEVCEYVFR
jgi:hypothetical protein